MKKHVEAWLEHYKHFVLYQEIFPNRYHAFFYELCLLCRFRLDKKIAFIPCGHFIIEFQKRFHNPNFYFFDDVQKEVESFHFLNDNSLLERMDYIVIATKTYEVAILEKLPKKLQSKVVRLGPLAEGINFQKELQTNLSSFRFLKFLICLKKSYQTPLEGLLQSYENVMFVRQNNYSDVKDKVSIMAECLACEVVYENNALQTPQMQQGIQSRLLDMLVVFLNQYREKRFIFFIPIVMDGYGLTYIMKTKFLHVKVIANFTDYIYDLCQYTFRELLAQNYSWSLAYTEAEYAFANALVHHNIVDGIIHRHGDVKGSWCHVYQSPELFFPPYQNSYPKIANHRSEKKRLVFIGSIHSAAYDSELFSRVFLEDIFALLIQCGYSIDVYYSKGYKNRALAYSQKINNPLFTIIEGEPLESLLPKINGKYDWGLVLNDLSKGTKLINTNYRYAIPTKIYTYASIHLPIIYCGEHSNAMSLLIEHNGIGINIHSDDLRHDIHAIETHNYETLVENIDTFNAKNALEKNKVFLENFCHTTVCDKNGIANEKRTL